MMTHITSPQNFQPNREPPQPDFQQTTLYSPVTRAGLHVHRRYGVRPEIADLVAAVAGIAGSG
jgi:hypothetical protein